MEELADRTLERRWQLMGMLIVHRVGEMRPGEPIVLVAAAARHRRAAIQAVDFAMDHLKSDALVLEAREARLRQGWRMALDRAARRGPRRTQERWDI